MNLLSTDHPSVGIVIPTFKGEKHLHHLLPHLINSPIKPRILIIDSSYDEKTLNIAKNYPIEILQIDQKSFNHGLTRELGRKKLNTDIIVYFTQDAYPENKMTLSHLLEPLLLKKAVISYARQLPHLKALPLEAFARMFNYPEESSIRGIEDLEKFESYLIFCSNSCAAYLNSALDKIGGFDAVLTGEDTVATAKLLKLGEKISYTSKARVYHSHNYTLKEEFYRHLDTGYARSSYENVINFVGRDEKRGKIYVKKLFRFLLKNHPLLIPYAFFHVGAKWLGYTFGKLSYKINSYKKIN